MYDLITRPLTAAVSGDGVSVGYNFYDLNAKINHIFSPKDRVYLSFYSGGDNILTRQKVLREVNKSTLEWGNILGIISVESSVQRQAFFQSYFVLNKVSSCK